MKNCLVVYYSRSGMTRRVAEQIASTCACDIEAIREAKSREGIGGFLRSAYQAVTGKAPAYLPTGKDPADYQLVILGTPVWAGHVSAPIRSYICRNRERFNHVAAFSTMHASGGDKALREIAELCGKAPVGQLSLTDNDIICDRRRDDIVKFGREPGPLAVH